MKDEEVAFRIVRLYFEEIAKLGFKRTLDLDQMIDAYFYTLKKLGNKDVLVKKALDKINENEKTKSNENKSEGNKSNETKSTSPTASNSTPVTTSTTTSEVTRVSIPKEKTITQIIEED